MATSARRTANTPNVARLHNTVLEKKRNCTTFMRMLVHVTAWAAISNPAENSIIVFKAGFFFCAFVLYNGQLPFW